MAVQPHYQPVDLDRGRYHRRTAAIAAGNYGTLGVAAAGNLPPERRGGGASWVDASGNLWLFGGIYGAEVSGSYVSGYYNDLWKYNPSSNQWTSMGGSNTPVIAGTASGTFGTKRTPSTANIPSGRFGAVSWTDKNGNLWMFGGSGVDSAGASATLNDLWRYNPATGAWTWMTGNSAAGPSFIERFHREQHILGSLDHPHITRMIDAGLTETGQPYLVMEYVEGEHLDVYCDARKLGVTERLELFLQICEAVDYAHRNLVVHLDLKPSNILVTSDGMVKLLDFGNLQADPDGNPADNHRARHACLCQS